MGLTTSHLHTQLDPFASKLAVRSYSGRVVTMASISSTNYDVLINVRFEYWLVAMSIVYLAMLSV